MIVDAIDHFFNAPSQDLYGRKILITAGPTYEKIDPVRFIGNYSSGKMGFAIAEECARRGALVQLVAGPVSMTVNHHNINRVDVESCQQMYEACMDIFPNVDVAILCAAVADFRPETVADTKIKRKGDDLMLHLAPNKDIAAALGNIKNNRQVMVGFALETDNEENNAVEKLKKKNLDFIVLNSLKNKGTCFKSDENQIKIISQDGMTEFERKPKTEVAADIVNYLAQIMKPIILS